MKLFIKIKSKTNNIYDMGGRIIKLNQIIEIIEIILTNRIKV